MMGRDEKDYIKFGPIDKYGASELGCVCIQDDVWPEGASKKFKPVMYKIFHVRKVKEGLELRCPGCGRGVLLKGEIVDMIPFEKPEL